MSNENFFVKALTPKNTEELKPGLFIQTTARGYRNVYPAAWNGKINWYNFFFGGSFFKTFAWFAIILFVVWSYQHDVNQYKSFYEDVVKNPIVWCQQVEQSYASVCSPQQEAAGLCNHINYSNLHIEGLDIKKA